MAISSHHIHGTPTQDARRDQPAIRASVRASRGSLTETAL
jgi:hypothetical protein